MNTLEKIELGLIPLTGFLAYAAAPLLPEAPSLGHLMLILSALLLLQSLLRDLAILARRRSAEIAAGPMRTMRCMCVESTVGMTGIVVGAGLFGFGFGGDLAMSPAAWAVAALLTLVLGFAIKDFVLRTTPWRIVRDPDHVNIVVSWRQ